MTARYGAYLLCCETGIWLVFAPDAKTADETLKGLKGDLPGLATLGAWRAEPGTVIDLRSLWPHYAPNPPEKYTPW